jgi:hypothetical protein
MQARVQLVTIIGAVVLLLTVLEMVRRRRLMERYALLWLFSAGVLLALAVWSGALVRISHAIGVIYPPNALFFIAIGCIVLLLLHFSSVASRLSDQSETLAQRQALLDERLRRQERLVEEPVEQPLLEEPVEQRLLDEPVELEPGDESGRSDLEPVSGD